MYECITDVLCSDLGYVFFFKQKTAYEMRISVWSSDLCSSDLFYYDYKDLQVTRAASDPTTGAVVNLTENATTAKLKGIDLDLGWAITSDLTLDASMNLLDSKYGKYLTIGQLLNSIATGDPEIGRAHV